jgi:Spy/CpxP family protein refolding chaperone
MTKRFCLSVAIATVFCSQLVCAQPGPGRGPRPWWDSDVSRDLNLSDAQTKQIQSTVQEFRGRMMDVRSTVNKTESDVEAAFNEDPVDQTKANDAINRLAAARGELTKAVSQMDLKLRTILTAQQWQELQKRERRPGPGMRRRGPVLNAPPTSTNAPPTSSLKQDK